MNILGIESSCDETSAAIVTDGTVLRSNIVASSLPDHQRFGGVIPEIASRRQLEYISLVVSEALNNASLRKEDLDAIAVTLKPGLIGSLLVGISFAKAFSAALDKPFIGINHVHAHIYANCLRKPEASHETGPVLPAIGLAVSGGHSSLYFIRDFRSFKLIGETRDDAAGEAYDKVARILGLGYPGGPVIDKIARSVTNNTLRFKCAQLEGSYDFSFSGIKTAVLYHVREHGIQPGPETACVVAAFQESVVASLVEKSLLACRKKKVKTLLVGGGVSANSALRSLLSSRAQQEGIRVFFPPFDLCTDNAAMIAGLAFHYY